MPLWLLSRLRRDKNCVVLSPFEPVQKNVVQKQAQALTVFVARVHAIETLMPLR